MPIGAKELKSGTWFFNNARHLRPVFRLAVISSPRSAWSLAHQICIRPLTLATLSAPSGSAGPSLPMARRCVSNAQRASTLRFQVVLPPVPISSSATDATPVVQREPFKAEAPALRQLLFPTALAQLPTSLTWDFMISTSSSTHAFLTGLGKCTRLLFGTDPSGSPRTSLTSSAMDT